MAKRIATTKANTTKGIQRKLLEQHCSLVPTKVCSDCDKRYECLKAEAWRKSIVTKREKASSKLRETERSEKWAAKKAYMNEQVTIDSEDDDDETVTDSEDDDE